jgi:hypothetical protein
MDLTRLQAIQEQKAQAQKEKQSKLEREVSELKLQETIVRTAKMVVEFMQGHTTKTVLLNQIEDFATSQDAEKLIESINSLHDTLKTHENTDISPLTEVMKEVLEQVSKIPKEHREEKEQKFVDYTKQIESLTKAVQLVEKSVKEQKLIAEAPIVTYKAPDIHVDAPDLKSLAKDVEDAFKTAIGLISIPEPEKIKPVVDELKRHTNILKDIRDVTGGGSSGTSSIAPFLVNGALPITGSITASSSTLADFSVNDIEDDATSYFGKTKPDGTWLVQKVTDTSVSYATVTNNGSVTTYTDAWTNRLTLTYGRFDEAF